MNRKPTIASVIFSVLMGVTLIVTAINPTAARAAASAPPAKASKAPPPTATPTPIVTETPVTTVEPLEAVPGLTLRSDPTYLVPGGQVTFLYQIGNFEKINETTLLRFHAPPGLAPMNPEEGKWDEDEGVFELIVTAGEGKSAWQAEEGLVPPVGIWVELIDEGQTVAEATLELKAAEEFKIETSGGSAAGKGGEVQVIFPSGAVAEAVMVKVTEPSYESLPVQSLSGSPFEITAVSESERMEVSAFDRPVEIWVNYAEGALDGGEEDILLFWYDPSDGQWKMPLSQHVDTENNRIVATTNHFTVFDTYNSNWQTAQTPTLEGFQTSDFTGAATYSMPITLPPGPGGFQPGLSLSYNSMVVDASTSETQASWVGMGWSLTTSYIERAGHGTNGILDDAYQLVLNGTSIEILPDENGVYHASNKNFYRFEPSDLGNTNTSKWTIWDKSGNQYVFDHRAVRNRFTECGSQDGAEIHHDVWRWSLTQVVNVFGQVMNYEYEKETSTHAYLDCGANLIGATREHWVYPTAIVYANGKYRVVFDRANTRTDYKNIWMGPTTIFNVFQRSRLNGIRIQQDSNDNGVFDAGDAIVREYVFGYASDPADHIFPNLVWDAGGRTLTLLSVTEYGLGGAAGGQSLPPHTFTYGDGMHLTGASNGYGGTITFGYEDHNHNGASELPWKAEIPYQTWGADEILYGPPSWGNPKAYQFSNSTEGWVGTTSTVFPFITGTITHRANGTVDVWGLVENSNASPIASKSFQPGRWYMAVAAVRAVGGSPAIQLGFGIKDASGAVTNSFGTAVPLTSQTIFVSSGPVFVPVNSTALIPKMNSSGTSKVAWILIYPLTTAYRVTSRTVSANGDALTTLYDYAGAALNTPENSEATAGEHPYARAYTEFRGHAAVTVTDPFGGRREAEYLQSDCYAGSPSLVTVKDANGVTARESAYEYEQECIAGTSNMQLIDHDTRNPLLFGTPFDPLYYYWPRTNSETSTVYGAAGGSLTTAYDYESTYGNLVSQSVFGDIPHTLTTTYQYLAPIIDADTYIVSLPTRVAVSAGTSTLAETLTAYNGDGIPTRTRALMSAGQYSQMDVVYDTWGNVTSQTVYTDYSNGSSDPAAGAQTATTTYDPAYHTYPLTITNALGQTVTMAYDYSLGVPLSAYGPNGAATMVTAEYDSFGRLVKLIRPGDDSASPTLQIAYGTSPFSTTVTQKIQNGQFFSMTRQYDGLGRPTSVSAGGTTTLYQYGYIGGNRADQVSTPFASGETYYWATTKYDSLGRAWTSTAPDGSVTTYAYEGLRSKVTDANSIETSTTTDILGRTIFVDAPIGPDITFGYDDLGNLTSASRGGAETTMQYDLGGRKISMNDPDMGAWTYDYDALSNLKLQTDARGCTLTMLYDSLNRLDTKTSAGNCGGQQVNVTYGYDAYAAGSNYGIGFRTSMSDGTSALPSSWEYDYRGRLVKEIKRIDNQSFTTEWDYNSADLPVTMTYPDGETVTNQYNSNMLLENVAGAETYASAFSYDSANRLEALTIGTSLGQRYYYKDWNVQGGGRLDMTVTGTGAWTEASKTFATTLLKNSYSYDSVGNITNINDSIWGETQTFGYDSLYRLTSASATGGQANYNETYQYDAATGNLVNKNGLVLNYPSPNGARPHAVTSAGSNTYGYDANGNQITRTIAGQTVTLAYDAENRLVSATGTNLSATFTFDGDGRRVKSVVNGETILFAGGHFELKGNEVTKYYFAVASRIAVRKYIVPQSSTLTYLAGDHLGSTSLAVDASTGEVIQTRYKPWGEVRYTTPSKTLPTRYTFTGQYSYVSDDATDLGNAGFGLMFYNARWYDPLTGRMSQADSIVPGGVQGLDRYAYVANNPVVYTDPSGHAQYRSDNWWSRHGSSHKQGTSSTTIDPSSPGTYHHDDVDCAGHGQAYLDICLKYYFVTIESPDDWSEGELRDIYNGLEKINTAFGSDLTTMYRAFGNVTFVWAANGTLGKAQLRGKEEEAVGRANWITGIIWLTPDAHPIDVVHEMGHLFDKGAKSKDWINRFSDGSCLWPCKDGTWSPTGKNTDYGDTNPLEDFADSFAKSVWYLKDGGWTYFISKERFFYILSLIHNYRYPGR